MTEFSDKLSALRESKGWSKSTVARKLHISPQRYSNYEYGYRQPDYENLKAIAKIYEVDIDYLLDADENSQNDDVHINDNPTFADLGMPYGGDIPSELRDTYLAIAQNYFKHHPEAINDKYRKKKDN